MIKKWTWLLIFISGICSAQTFSTIIDEGYESLPLEIIVEPESLVLSVGHLQCDSWSGAKSYSFYRMSHDGDILYRKNYDICPVGHHINDFGGMITKDSQYIVMVSLFDTITSTYMLHIDYLDYTFERIKRVPLSRTMDLHDIARKGAVSGDKMFFLYGKGNLGRGDTAYVAVYDMEGNQHRNQVIEYEQGNVVGNHMIPTDDGGVLVSLSYRELSLRASQMVIVKLDNNGDVVWRKDSDDLGYDPEELECKRAVTFTGFSDGSFALSLCRDTFLGFDYHYKHFNQIYFYDSQGIKEAVHLIPTMYRCDIWRMSSDQNRNIYGYGYGREVTHINGAWVFKANKEKGLIWRRFFNPENNEISSFFFNMNVLEDHSLIMIGAAQNQEHGHGDSWILKIDSNGCLFPNCDNQTTVSSDDLNGMKQATNFQVVPNPVIGQVSLEIDHAAQRELSFEIIDIMGNTRDRGKIVIGQSSVMLDVTQYSSGMYWFRIRDKNGFFQSVPWCKI